MAPGGWAPFLPGDCARARPEEGTTVTESGAIKRTLPWRIVAAVNGAAEKVVALITAAARTGSIGDGKVFVVPLEDAFRIRTGERGDSAV